MNQPGPQPKNQINGLFVILASSLVILLIALTIFTTVLHANTPKTKEQIAQEDLDKSADLAFKSPDEQLSVRQDDVNNAKTPAEKAKAYVQLATTYLNQADYVKVKENLDLALAQDPTNEGAISAYYSLSVSTKNVADQIKYIKLLLDNLNPNSPLYEADKQSYQDELTRLENVN